MSSLKSITQEYITKYPDLLNLTLAKLMHHERPDLFKSADNARSLIRMIKGAQGNKSRKGKEKTAFFEIAEIMQKYAIEQAARKYDTEFKLSGEQVIGVISDIHIPHQDNEALTAALSYLYEADINTLLINGDLVDFYQISRFSRDPLERSFCYEVEMTKNFFIALREMFGDDIRILWKLGNHEDRYESFLRSNAPQLLGIEHFSLKALFELEKYNVELILSKQKIKAGKLNIVHGHEFGESIFSPVNPARGLFLRAKASTLAGHNHQTSEHHENDINNNPTGCWSMGCLCSLTPEYRPFAFTKWNHGGAVVYVHEDDSFHVDNFRIIDGVMV